MSDAARLRESGGSGTGLTGASHQPGETPSVVRPEVTGQEDALGSRAATAASPLEHGDVVKVGGVYYAVVGFNAYGEVMLSQIRYPVQYEVSKAKEADVARI